MKKIVFLIGGFLLLTGRALAQEAAPITQASHHNTPFTKPDAYIANTIIWVSVGVVVYTLILTLKYMFKPEEDNPDHIKNIVLDEGF